MADQLPHGQTSPTDDVPGLADVLSPEGWPNASSASTGPDDPGRFNCLFGRDSLITALQVLPVRPDVATATLRALAARQGTVEDPGTLEAPGKIGHEFRDHPPSSFVARGWPDEGPFAYYGTADATPWFLVLLAATGDAALVEELEPAWRAAAGWLLAALDAGDGLVRHAPGTRPALVQQGWRDTVDPTNAEGGGSLRPDGTAPTPPLADADTQAVAVAALRAAARLSGDEIWTERAAAMRTRVTTTYLPEVMVVEAGDLPVPGAGSQLGWLLWADAVEPDAVGDVAERLTRPDVATPYGLRTLSSDSPVFDPQAYHRGSIWPFDNWLGWGGLRAAGHHDAAEKVRRGVLDAIATLGGYPELYCVDADGTLQPSRLSNRVQAWSIGAHWALTTEWDGRR